MSKVVTQVEETISGLPAGYEASGSLAVSLARAEIDQQIATSRALPRSVQRAISNITTLATLDEETAEECIYAVPRGGKTIRGPSIRFAEIMASQWGNCRVGARVVHVDKIEGYVEAEGVFHDLETNVAQTARVRRTIQAKRGRGIDADMIQLAGAAACSIARRNAILSGIPKGIARKGYLAVESVIRGDIKTLAERRDAALRVFTKIGVAEERIFAALDIAGVEEITLDHLATLTGAKSALKNGEATLDELFPAPTTKAAEPKGTLADRLDALASVDPETGEVKPENQDATETKETGAGESSALAPEAAAGEAGRKPDSDTNARVTAAADPFQGKSMAYRSGYEDGEKQSKRPTATPAFLDDAEAPDYFAGWDAGNAAKKAKRG
ncbi:MAG: hypothetical protein ACR65U_14570 [Methylocystis sp.]